MTAPSIPAACAHRPTTRDGLVVPFANVKLADGGCDFRAHHQAAWARCWRDGLCQVCGHPLTHPIVLLCGPRQVQQLLFDEPPTHPECARYVVEACPMVAGHRARYATGPTVSARSRGSRCPDPGCDCAGWVPHPGAPAGGQGDPAHAWFAVWVRDYALAVTREQGVTGGICPPEQVLRVRQVSEPGGGPLRPWREVPDWLDRYRPPDLIGAGGAPALR